MVSFHTESVLLKFSVLDIALQSTPYKQKFWQDKYLEFQVSITFGGN